MVRDRNTKYRSEEVYLSQQIAKSKVECAELLYKSSVTNAIPSIKNNPLDDYIAYITNQHNASTNKFQREAFKQIKKDLLEYKQELKEHDAQELVQKQDIEEILLTYTTRRK